MSSFLGRKDLTRGIRNNNPGNLIITSSSWIGKVPFSKNTDKHFEQFTEMKYGIRAMLIDLIGDIGKGKNTIRKLISEYAPPTENNTNNYVNVVSKAMGLNPDSVIKEVDFTLMLQLAKAIIKHENGKDSENVKDSDIFDAIDIIDREVLNGVVINVKRNFKFNVIIFPILLFFYTVLVVTV